MASDGFLSGPGLQNAVLSLAQSAETGALRVLHALGLAPDVSGQAGWPFARRIATETLLIDAGLARRRARALAWVAALALAALAPWPASSLLLTDAQATSFHRSPTGFDSRSIAKGLALYQARCASCHGADGDGEGPLAAGQRVWPPRLDGPLSGRRAEGELFGTVMAGRHDRHGTRTMPGFAGGLDDADAWALVDANAKRRDDVLQAVFAELRGAGAWIKANPAEAAQWYAPVIGLDAATVAAANARRSYAVQALDAASLAEQQRIADAFTAAGVLPRKVAIAETPVWRPV
jgi:mono/diheme cytochrome c family protein